MGTQMDYLAHHGILGMKWGIRRYQNDDGTLTEAGRKRYGRETQQKEKKAINAEYKRARKAGGNYVLPMFRYSTGESYNKAVAEFRNKVKSDSEFKRLSKEAYNAEVKRLSYADEHLPNTDDASFDDAYDRLYKDRTYAELCQKSENAAAKKGKRLDDLSKEYVDVIKDAKIHDLGITNNLDLAKKYISDKFDDFVWDGNIEYNPDTLEKIDDLYKTSTWKEME